MASVDCTIHLVCLKPDTTNDTFLKHLNDESAKTSSPVIKGRVHGWVHQPHRSEQRAMLLSLEWDAFFLTREAASPLPGKLAEIAKAHVSIGVAIPQQHFERLQSNADTKPKAIASTPPLPDEWPKHGGIPSQLIQEGSGSARRPGELVLNRSMADFLTSTLPASVRDEPVSLFNLFKYPNKDSAVHDHYMEGFKDKFGNAAGASVKFMGPVTSAFASAWQDANLVQYDTIWHYAYMLSTDVYQELNKEKMEGLEDTCILCVSEVELA